MAKQTERKSVQDKELTPRQITAEAITKLNIREFATRKSHILETVQPGTQFVIEVVNQDWAHIVTSDATVQNGYVMRQFIKEI